MNITQDWREQDRRYYGKVTQAKSDSFAESRLFTDNALAALLNRHLVEKIDVCTMGHDPNFPHKHSICVATHLTLLC